MRKSSGTRMKWLAMGILLLTLLAAGVGCEPQEATPTLFPTEEPTEMPTEMPTEEPAGEPTEAPEPTVTPEAGLPSDTIALYASGPDGAGLFALPMEGDGIDLEMDVYRDATISRDGMWVASPDSAPPAGAVILSNLETEVQHTVVISAGFNLHGMAFDPDATRLAFVVVGPPQGDATAWAIILVDVEDGSTQTFPATAGPGEIDLPGTPIGWIGDELFLNAFIPYTEEGSAGVWGIRLPEGIESTPFDALEQRNLLRGDSYLFRADLAPEIARLLYLGRDPNYVPAGYEPIAYDIAVNRLWVLDLDVVTPTLLVEVTDGGALATDAAWSPDGTRILYAEGTYAGDAFDQLILKIYEQDGTIQEVTSLSLSEDGGLYDLAWCAPDLALVTLVSGPDVTELYAVDLAAGEVDQVASGATTFVTGCIK